MKDRKKIIKFQRKLPIYFGIINILFNIVYFFFNKKNAIEYLVYGLIVSCVILGFGGYAKKLSMEEELLVDEILRLKKENKNISNDEMRKYLVEKYGVDTYRKVVDDKNLEVQYDNIRDN